jgi:excisionase family DNA binding protein
MQYMTVKQYADFLGVTRQAIEDRISRGTLPTVRKDRKVKVTMIAVEDTVRSVGK